MIYGNRFLTVENCTIEGGLMIIENDNKNISSILEHANLSMVTEASIKEIFTTVMSKVKEVVVKILKWIAGAIEFITNTVLNFIQKCISHLSKNESALLEAEEKKEKKFYCYDLNHEALKLNNGKSTEYATSVITCTTQSMGEALISDFDTIEKCYRSHNQYVPSHPEYYEEWMEEIEAAMDVFNQTDEKLFIKKSEVGFMYKWLMTHYNREVAAMRETDRVVKEFESKYSRIENTTKRINNSVTSDSSEYKQSLQKYMNQLYSYSYRYMAAVPKVVSKYLSVLTKGLKYNLKTLMSMARAQGLPKDQLDQFQKSFDDFQNNTGDYTDTKYLILS